MSTTTHDMSQQTTRILRIAGWSTAILLLIAPAIAMQFEGNGVNWTAGDFIFAGVIFAIVGGLFELTARASANFAYRIAVVMAVACGFLQIWINLAVAYFNRRRYNQGHEACNPPQAGDPEYMENILKHAQAQQHQRR